jgi:penicillin-binding protein 1C
LLSGIRDGAVIKRLPGRSQATLPLQATGGEGRRWWFLNGEPLDGHDRLTGGEYQLLVMDDAGQVAAVEFAVQ